MPFHPFIIDESIESTGSKISAHVLQGYYLLQIAGGQLTPPDYEKEMNICWTCKIMDGPDGIGRLIYRYTTWENKKQWPLGALAYACGVALAGLKDVQVPNYETLQALSTQIIGGLQGKQFCALLGDSDYTTTKSSEIKETFPEKMYAELAVNNARMAQQVMAPVAPVLPQLPNGMFPGIAPVNGAPQFAPQPAPQMGVPGVPFAQQQMAPPPVSGELTDKVAAMFQGVNLGG